MFRIKLLFLSLFLLSAGIFLSSCSDSTTSTPPDDKAPSISSISPDKGYAGTSITITGEYFRDEQGTGFVSFATTNIQNVTEWSDTKIVIKVPDDAVSGDVKISVTADSRKSNEVVFKVLEPGGDAPVITNLSKKIGMEGQTLAIFGKNFGDSRGTSYVTFNDLKVNENDYPIWETGRIIVVIPEGAQTGQVTVWVNDVPSNSKDFEIQPSFKLLTMVKIDAGSFTMGDDNNTESDNKPAHTVTISKDFYMSAYEITQKQWKTIMDGDNPSHPTDTGDTKPVQQVKFNRVLLFCNRLSVAEGYTPVYTIDGYNYTWDLTANGYRLPTEAEWEYACRAGRTEDYTNSEVIAMAWVSENAAGHSKEVGQKTPNSWGLYDILGNVAEWCWDLYDADYYAKSPDTDPRGPAASDFNDRIVRGGSWANGADKVNSTIRYSFPGANDNYNYDIGFRVVRN